MGTGTELAWCCIRMFHISVAPWNSALAHHALLTTMHPRLLCPHHYNKNDETIENNIITHLVVSIVYGSVPFFLRKAITNNLHQFK